MITLEYLKANVIVELGRGLNGYQLSVKKGGKSALELTFSKRPNLSITETGLLYVNDWKTFIYDLNGGAPLTTIREDKDLWVASYFGNNVYSSVQPNAMIRDISGNLISGFVVRNEETKECKSINNQIKFNPIGLKVSPDGKKWLVYDVRNKNITFGNEGAVLTKFAWNKGQLGDMAEEFEVDWDNNLIFVAIESLSFKGVISIGFNGTILQTEIDKVSFMQPKLGSYDALKKESELESDDGGELLSAYDELKKKIEKIGFINLLTEISKLQDTEVNFVADGDLMFPNIFPLLKIREHDFVGLVPFQGAELEKWPVAFYNDEGGELCIFASSLMMATKAYLASIFDTKTHESAEEKNRLFDTLIREELVSELSESPDLQVFIKELIEKTEKGEYKMSELYHFAEGETFMTEHYRQIETNSEKISQFTIVKSTPEWDSETLEGLLLIGNVTENEDYKGYLGWVQKEKETFKSYFSQ